MIYKKYYDICHVLLPVKHKPFYVLAIFHLVQYMLGHTKCGSQWHSQTPAY